MARNRNKRKNKVVKEELAQQAKAARDNLPYYTLDKALSRGAILNFITSGRGLGKTTAATLWCYKSFLRTGRQFMWVRRNEDEKIWAKSLFDVALRLNDNKHQVKINGTTFYIREVIEDDPEESYTENEEGEMESTVKYSDWKIFGYFVILAYAQSVKSGNFEAVNKIVFDEFILDDRRRKYIPNEVNSFVGLYDTVDRGRNEVTAVCLSNSGTFMNPYFGEYGVTTSDLSDYGFIKKRGGAVIFEYVDPSEYKEIRANSNVTAIAPKSYSNMADNNTFDGTDNNNVEAKPKDAKPIAIIHYHELAWTIYKAPDGHLWGTNKVVKIANHWNADPSDLSLNMKVLDGQMKKYLKLMITNNNFTYDSPDTKLNLFELLYR